MATSHPSHSVLTMTVLVLVIAVTGVILFNLSGVPRGEEEARVAGFTTNYASAYLGATLTDFSRACKGSSSLLNDDTEKYMICACEVTKKFFTVQLIRLIEVRIIALVNLEHFSAGVRNFTLLGSRMYPTNEWRVLGSFEARPHRGTQHFDVPQQEPVRFLRLLWVTSHGDDSWCTLTSFRTYGVDVLETLSEEYVIDGDDVPQLPPSLPALPEVAVPSQAARRAPTGDTNAAPHSPHAASEWDAEATRVGNGELFMRVGADFPALTGSAGGARRYREAIVYNASLTCDWRERAGFQWADLGECRAPLPTGGRLPKAFQASSSALYIVTQLSKQLKALQHELDEMRPAHAEVAQRLERGEALVRLLGARIHETSRSTTEYKEKMVDILKELEVMRARLTIVLDRHSRGGGGDAVLWVWLLCSNAISFLALSCSFFATRQPTTRLPLTSPR